MKKSRELSLRFTHLDNPNKINQDPFSLVRLDLTRLLVNAPSSVDNRLTTSRSLTVTAIATWDILNTRWGGQGDDGLPSLASDKSLSLSDEIARIAANITIAVELCGLTTFRASFLFSCK